MRRAIDAGWGAACKPPRAARCWGTYIAPDLPWRCKSSPKWPVGCRVQTTPIIHNFQPLFEHLKSPIRFPVQCHKNREPQINRSRELTPSVWGVFTLWLGKFRKGVAFVVGLLVAPNNPQLFRLKNSSGQRTTELLATGSQARLCQGKFCWRNSRVFCVAWRTYRKSMVPHGLGTDRRHTFKLQKISFEPTGSIWIPLWTWHLSFFSKTPLPKGLTSQCTA